jgi:hypothetical protein
MTNNALKQFTEEVYKGLTNKIREEILKIPPRTELIGGQNYKYIRLEDVLNLLIEIQEGNTGGPMKEIDNYHDLWRRAMDDMYDWRNRALQTEKQLKEKNIHDDFFRSCILWMIENNGYIKYDKVKSEFDIFVVTSDGYDQYFVSGFTYLKMLLKSQFKQTK